MTGELLLALAGLSALIGAAGLHRFPDVYNRMHAATMITVGGTVLGLLVLLAQNLGTVYAAKLLLVVIFMLLTSPAANHAVLNAALRMGIRPARLVRRDLC